MAIPIANTIIRAFMIMPPSVWKYGGAICIVRAISSQCA